MSIKSGNRLKKVKSMPRINLEEIAGEGKQKKEGPLPIYLNFKSEDEAYERLDKVRKKYGVGKVKALLSILVKSADF